MEKREIFLPAFSMARGQGVLSKATECQSKKCHPTGNSLPLIFVVGVLLASIARYSVNASCT